MDEAGGTFGAHLADLFERAGGPSLRSAAHAVSRAGGSASAQRISDWRTGRHLPRSFAAVEPLLVWLTARAASGGVDDLLSIGDWEAVWSAEIAAEDRDCADLPFPGLAPFDDSRSEMFFGRGAVIDDLVSTVTAAAGADGPALVVVTGVSGAGKSSLLGAGITRALGRTPAMRGPVSRARLTPDGVAGLETVSTAGLVVLDQFESVFSLDPPARATVIDTLDRLARERPVVLGIRSDFFDRCVRVPLLARAWRAHCVIVGPMTDAELREAISGPVRAVGGRIESGLPDLLLAELCDVAQLDDDEGRDTPARLPLLAHALASTWQRSAPRMTVAAYRETGGIASALGDTAERAWDDIVAAGHQDVARSLLVALTVFGPGDIPLRGRLTHQDLDRRFPAEAREVIEILAAARLLTVTADDVTLVHDVVLRAWPRLAGWLREDRAAHLARQQLDEDARAWVETGRDPSFLYRGARLAEALRMHRSYSTRYRHLLSGDDQEFLDRAVAAGRRRRTVVIGAVALVVVLAIVSTVAAAIGLQQSSALRGQRDAAQRAALLSQIQNVAGHDPSLAQRLRLVAHDRWPGEQSVDGDLLSATTQPLARVLTGHDGPVYDLGYSRDGRLLASASGDRTVRLWETGRDGRRRTVSVLSGFGDYVTSVAFSPTAPVVAAASGDGTVRIWDIGDPSSPRMTAVLRPGRGTVYVIAFSDDGTRLAAPSDDSTVTLYTMGDPRSPQQMSVLRGHTGPVRTVAFVPGRHIVASGGDDATVRFWDTADPTKPVSIGPPVAGFSSIAHSIAFSADATRMTVSGDSPDITVLDITDLARPVRVVSAVPGTTAGSWSVAYGPRSDLLASASEDGIVKVWSVAGSTVPQLVWSLQSAPEQSALTSSTIAFSPDGSRLTAGLSDGSIADWSLPSTVVHRHSGAVTGVAVDATGDLVASVGTDMALTLGDVRSGNTLSRIPIDAVVNNHPTVSMRRDGRQVATARNSGGRVQLFDTTDPRRPRPAAVLDLGTRFSYHSAYSPDGRLLATGDTDRSVVLWDTTNPDAPRRVSPSLGGLSDLVRDVAFSPDGTRLAIASDDKTTRVVDVHDPAAPRMLATLTDPSPLRGVTWSPDGRTLYTAAEDLTAWRLDAATPRISSRIPAVYAVTVGTVGTGRLAVGTSTRQMRLFDATADGHLTAGPTVSGTDTADTDFVLPPVTRGNVVATGGDRVGSVVMRTVDDTVARRWVCATTDPISPENRSRYLAGLGSGGDC
ncbi:hypothetical protein [uncultured Williamsia sp.]|uniref:nSTAND1 domain-containing NTPase n=1 Tax=uncultured Williamsia sp. TaxID=259311 RepID=UPI0026372491|nr:hypothetical protein [uncultured Williamsia sp.]